MFEYMWETPDETYDYITSFFFFFYCILKILYVVMNMVYLQSFCYLFDCGHLFLKNHLFMPLAES